MFTEKQSWKTFGIMIFTFMFLLVTSLWAKAEPAAPQDQIDQVCVRVDLEDGSRIMGMALTQGITIIHTVLGRLSVPPARIKFLRKQSARDTVQMTLDNGDSISGAWERGKFSMQAAVGVIDVPLDILKSIEVAEVVYQKSKANIINMTGNWPPDIDAQDSHNVAYKKNVISHQGDWQDRVAAHLTDGDHKTLAFPGSSTLDYEIDMQRKGYIDQPSGLVYQIEEIVINWGVYAAPYLGKRDEKGGWVPAGYPGQYTTQYTIQYQDDDAKPDEWKTLHECNISPNLEDALQVEVHLYPPPNYSYTNYVVTHIKGLHVRRATKLRLIAKGQHWIGALELIAYGKIESNSF